MRSLSEFLGADPLITSRAVTELGLVVKMSSNATDANSAKAERLTLCTICNVSAAPPKDSEGEYMNHSLTYKHICLYNARSKTGFVAAFFLNNGRNADGQGAAEDIAATLATRTLPLNASCYLLVERRTFP